MRTNNAIILVSALILVSFAGWIVIPISRKIDALAATAQAAQTNSAMTVAPAPDRFVVREYGGRVSTIEDRDTGRCWIAPTRFNNQLGPLTLAPIEVCTPWSLDLGSATPRGVR